MLSLQNAGKRFGPRLLFQDANWLITATEKTALVGANGTGKSTLFSVFGFLKDALTDNVHVALTKLGGSRGFAEVRSRNAQGPIEIEIKFRERADSPLITYCLAISEDKGRPIVEHEILKYRRGSKGRPWHFLDFSSGVGKAVTNEPDKVTDEADLQREDHTLKSSEILAVKGLAQFEKFPASKALGDLIENWHVSDGTIKMFGYLVLLHDPKPHPLLCVEEPENQLYPKLLGELAEEFRNYASRGGQVFVSTHSPDFLNATQLDEVFWLVKEQGSTTVRRAREDAQVASYMAAIRTLAGPLVSLHP